ncbi:hypothetical protein Cni_G26295 [Canna indica]|uniref:WEB family protein n=1 Tax=Canna indica TaxID=4628 RepID=A0AAQ3KYR3_9LILI|nr:hypothetical protein Cni_G26295 [Canna indica]
MTRKGDMGATSRQNSFDSKAEIDTRAPFASVKAAVSLFGEVASTGRKSKPTSVESPNSKETQLHLAKRELIKYKEQLKNAESTRIQAITELERAKKTVEELTNKLNIINESKNLALAATENAKNQTRKLDVNSIDNTDMDSSWEQELQNAREQYAVAIMELDAAKQELRKIKMDCEALMETKLSSIQQEAEAKKLFESNSQKVAQLPKEIEVAKESLMLMRIAIEQAQQEESNILAEKASIEQTYKQALEANGHKLACLKKEFDPAVRKNLEAKLTETSAEIAAVRKEMKQSMTTTDAEFVLTATAALDCAKETLQKLAEEECSLVSLVDSLKAELEAARIEHAELNKMDAETESVVSTLHLKLQKCKADLDAAMAAELKAMSPSDVLLPTLQQLSSQTQKALHEAEEMKKSADELRGEAEEARNALAEAEKKLQVALRDAEEAKAIESRAIDLMIKDLSEKENVAQASTSESGPNITISKEEYESLTRKMESSEKLSEMNVAAVVAEVELVKASENEAIKKLEAVQKEMEEIERATEEALNRAEMAEAAKKVVERELRRWREKEHARADTTSNKADTQLSSEGSSSKPGHGAKPEEKTEETRKFSRPISRKSFIPNIGGFFHRKKSLSASSSQPYNPDEKAI